MAAKEKKSRGKCDAQFWTKEKTFKLIELFESNSDLWDSSTKLYCDNVHKKKLLAEMADELQTDPAEVKTKLHNLRCQYNSALRKLKNQKQGTNLNEHNVPRWEFFNALKFLSNVKRPCTTLSNYKVAVDHFSTEEEPFKLQICEETANTCRTCARAIDNKKYENLFKENSDKILEQIRMVTGLMLKEDSGIPTVVCQCCLRDLEQAILFRNRCINTEKIWLERKQSKNFEKEQRERIEDEFETDQMETITGTENDKDYEIVEFVDPEKRESSAKSQISVCDKCGKTFSNRSNLREHLIRHSGVKNYQCNLCPYKIHSANLLKRHLLKHSDVRPFACKYCNRTFRCSSNRLDHEKSHTNERPYQCRYCDKRFYTFSLHSDHELVHTGVRKFYCEVCDQWFLRRTSLVTHYRSKTHKQREQQEALVSNESDIS